jgi:hypothetical protein
MSSNSNRGGARPGAGRPKLKTVKMPAKQDTRYLVVGISEKFWQEFCEAASETIMPLGDELQESDYVRFAEIVMVDGMDRYVRRKKRQAKKKPSEEP